MLDLQYWLTSELSEMLHQLEQGLELKDKDIEAFYKKYRFLSALDKRGKHNV